MAAQAQALSRQLVMINGFLLDVSLHEDHQFESEVTEYPVESGSNVVDNIRPKPIVVVMECIVSNTPINPDIINARSKVSEPADDAYAMLQKIRDDREPVTIRTSLQTFESMVLKDLTIARATGRGDELRFTATFQQIITVKNKRTTRVAVPSAKGPKTINGSLGNALGGTVFIAILSREWFDGDISAWRERAYSDKDTGVINLVPDSTQPTDAVKTQKLPPGHWQLLDGKPDFTPQSVWDNNSIDQNTQQTKTLGDLAKKNHKPWPPGESVQVDFANNTVIHVPGNQVHRRGRL